MQPFIHLHVHSQYSLLDGQADIKKLVDKAVKDGMPGMALTDHGNMFGIKEFANYAKKHNGKVDGKVKDLLRQADEAEAAGDSAAAADFRTKAGEEKSHYFKLTLRCEVYVANKSLHHRNDKTDRCRHPIVIANTQKRHHNPTKLVSQAWTEGFYSHPRTDKDALAAHREGLIICSACLGGEIPRLILAGRLDEADASVRWWKETFGDDYYIELQRHKTDVPGGNRETYEEQQRVNPELMRLARKYDIKVVATNDSHFVNAEDAEAHDRLICISTNNYLNDPSRMRHAKQEWF